VAAIGCRITSKVNIAAACCVLLSIATFVASHCANSCSGHGECQTGSLTTCTCYHGWTGGDCSMRKWTATILNSRSFPLLPFASIQRTTLHSIAFHPHCNDFLCFCFQECVQTALLGPTMQSVWTTPIVLQSAPTAAFVTTPQGNACAKKGLKVLLVSAVRASPSS
jgi:hypothetical protein